MENSKKRFSVNAMALCALFSALIAAGAFIKLPVYPVPVTLQVQFALLAGLLLGSRPGIISAAVYLLIGLTGIPVFARGGGIGYIFQPTFGYILGFVLGAGIAGRIVEKSKGTAAFKVNFAASLAGLAAVYALGVVYFWIISRFYLGKEIGIRYLLVNCFLLTLPGDIVMAALGALIAKRLKPAINKYLNF